MTTILNTNENRCQFARLRRPDGSPRVVGVLVVSRFRVEEADQERFRAELAVAIDALAGRAGFVSAESGRNLDDPALWVLVTRWADVGSYRRALSSVEVKMAAVPLLSRALDEPSAYEPADGGPSAELNRNVPR
jgi:quinol monooxygenase YgiN